MDELSNMILYLAFILLLITNIALIDSKKKQIKQERNDAIVFCVENPTDCKTEYLKLK